VRAGPSAAAGTVGLAGTPAPAGPLLAVAVPDMVRAIYQAKLQRTLVLTVVILLGLICLERLLRDGEGRRSVGDVFLRCWGLVALPLYAVAMYWPVAADFFQLTPLTGSQWLCLLAVIAPAALLCQLPRGTANRR
jgi:hypothetical protein